MQEPLHVGTLLIPGGEAVNGERMSQVVNPGLLACVSSMDACAIARKLEVSLERQRADGAAVLSGEKGGVGWPSPWPAAVVLSQDPAQLLSHGNQSRLAKLRVPNRQDRRAQVHVGASQRDRLAQAQTGSVVRQNHFSVV